MRRGGTLNNLSFGEFGWPMRIAHHPTDGGPWPKTFRLQDGVGHRKRHHQLSSHDGCHKSAYNLRFDRKTYSD